MTQAPLRVAIGVYDRTRPLFDGEVKVDAALELVAADTQESTFGLLEGRYAAGEMSLATYVKAREESDALRALPIFTHRKFFHQYVWTRRGAGFHSLADLRGKRVIVPMYWMTSSIWHRLMLEEEAGIGAADLRWIVLMRDRLESMRVPPGVEVEVVTGRTAVELLLGGAADALFHAATTPDLIAARDRLDHPFPDVAAAQRRYFERTRIFPPVHAIVWRKEHLAERRDAVTALGRAIEAAKHAAIVRLEDEARTSLPFIREYLDETHRVFGDPYRDGLEPNRSAIETFSAAAHAQGLTARPLAAEELFES